LGEKAIEESSPRQDAVCFALLTLQKKGGKTYFTCTKLRVPVLPREKRAQPDSMLPPGARAEASGRKKKTLHFRCFGATEKKANALQTKT